MENRLSSTTVATLGCCLVASLVAPVAAQERPPEPEVIRRLANGGPAEWESGVVWSLAVPPEERSRELLTAMILALDRSLDWQIRRQRGWETGGHLAQALAATRDPRILPSLAWYAYNGAPATAVLVDFGHEAVPHLLAVAMSPDAPGDHTRAALRVLASIVAKHGPGTYGEELAEAAIFHLSSPPDHYRSRWSNIDSINPLLGAIALAGVVRTAELLARLEEIATTTFAEIEETSGSAFLAARAPACARAMLDRTEPPSPLCDPGWWVTPPGW